MRDATQQCLDIAEKIIAVLDGGEIYKKYAKLKEKYFSSSSMSPELDPHLKKIALENRELSNKLENLKELIQNSDTLENYVISQFQAMQSKAVPNATMPAQLSIEEAAEALYQAIESRIESNTIVRQRITAENTELREKISSQRAQIEDDIKKLTDRHLESDHDFRKRREDVKNKISEIEAQVAKLKDDVIEIEEDNASLEDSLSAKDHQKDSTKSELQALQRRQGIATTRCEDLRNSASLLSSELEAKIKEIELLQAKQRFGVQDVDPEDIEELKMVEAEIKALEAENSRLSLELKKQRLSGVSLEQSEPTKLSSFIGL